MNEEFTQAEIAQAQAEDKESAAFTASIAGEEYEAHKASKAAEYRLKLQARAAAAKAARAAK